MLDQIIDGNRDWLILLARLLLVALYISTGWEKITGFSSTVGYMRSVNAPAPVLSAGIAAVLEFFGGIALLLGIATRPVALILVAFTLGTALIGHHFWTEKDNLRYENRLNFFKNISIMGGFLLLAVCGPGRFSVWP
jgi:putative oxidoreductase